MSLIQSVGWKRANDAKKAGVQVPKMTKEEILAVVAEEKARLRLPNLFHDYDKSPRHFSNWEVKFMEDMQAGYRRGLIKVMSDLSEKQQLAIERIEAKVYAVG